MNPLLPPPQNGAYRGPVLVDPARAQTGHDDAALAHCERRAVQHRRRAEATLRDRQREDNLAWWIGLAALAVILFFTMIDPALAWMAEGAPDNRPRAEVGR